MPKVKSFKSIGKHQTYDLEVDHPDHQFYLANGLLTSNSHAVSYAIDSYMCAWLLTYYEAEWLCAYMETQSGHPDKRAKALGELKAFGYEIVKVDINHASKRWTIMPDKKFMPSFLTVKSMGMAAVAEVEANRPYKTVYDLLWNDDGSWKHSKFNKRALENLIKIGAFDSMGLIGEGKTFSSYRQMYEIVVSNNTKIKNKKKGRDEFASLLITTASIEEWPKTELVTMSKTIVGSIDMDMLISTKLRSRLDEIGVACIDDHEKQGLYWFVLDDAIPKLTKNKRPYLLLYITGTSGKRHRMFCWGWDPQSHGMFELNVPYMAEISNSQFGYATSVKNVRMLGEKNS